MGTVGICTDSHAQLPAELADRFGVAVVPMTVRIGECEYLEGVDLGIDEFYALLADDSHPDVATVQPSPGQFALAYDDLAARGCTQILSIHGSVDATGTADAAAPAGALRSARLAAHGSPVPVRVVDTGTRSFGVGCCTWAAAEAIAAGAGLDEASALAERLAPHIRNVFTVGALDLVGAHRAGFGMGRVATRSDGIAVLSFRDGEVLELDRVTTASEAIAAMSRAIVAPGVEMRVAVGTADCAAAPLSEALIRSICDASNSVEVVRYRVGAAVGMHTGPGTITCVTFPSAP